MTNGTRGGKRLKHMKSKLGYLVRSTRKIMQNDVVKCPSCKHNDSVIVDRKYIVTTLRRCERCRLLFRTPITTSEESAAFYQQDYTQGFTTEMPSDEGLRTYIDSGFRGTEKDYSVYIRVLDGLGCTRGQKLLDFGCSWGYGSWQLERQGFSVESFEISIPRVEYARSKLGVRAFSTLSELSGPYDIFFAAHVLEHVPSVIEIIEFGLSILRPGGVFVAFTPNGAKQHRLMNPSTWHKLWGRVHPNFLDDIYYCNAFSDCALLLSSDPYNIEQLSDWRRKQKMRVIYDLSGGELLVAARKEIP